MTEQGRSLMRKRVRTKYTLHNFRSNISLVPGGPDWRLLTIDLYLIIFFTCLSVPFLVLIHHCPRRSDLDLLSYPPGLWNVNVFFIIKFFRTYTYLYEQKVYFSPVLWKQNLGGERSAVFSDINAQTICRQIKE